jgi:alkanesulfonate monooxygenase SsuD/methylene tetrahydromethanopterin reductase-like flavin-dependent oxidoreductase (luciferase family)
VQPGGVPIHIGGHSRAAARRAGRLGDGFQPLGLDGDVLADRLGVLRGAALDAGRDPARIELTLGGVVGRTTAADVDRAAEAGAHRLLLSTATADADDLQRLLTDFAAAHLR